MRNTDWTVTIFSVLSKHPNSSSYFFFKCSIKCPHYSCWFRVWRGGGQHRHRSSDSCSGGADAPPGRFPLHLSVSFKGREKDTAFCFGVCSSLIRLFCLSLQSSKQDFSAPWVVISTVWQHDRRICVWQPCVWDGSKYGCHEPQRRGLSQHHRPVLINPACHSVIPPVIYDIDLVCRTNSANELS